MKSHLSMVLRDVLEDDLPVLFEQQRDPEAVRVAAYPSREWQPFVLHWRTRVIGDPEVKKRIIVVDGLVAGHVLSWHESEERLVGYWLGRAHWGRGVATMALREFLKHETLRPLHARVAAHNVGSIRVLEKCGFVRTDTGEILSRGVWERRYQLRAV